MTAIFRERLLSGLLGFVAGVAITNFGVVMTIRNSVVRKYRSPQDLSTTVQSIVANAATHGWIASQPVAFEQDSTGRGYMKVPVRILELSHPEYTESLVAYGRNRSVAMAPTTLVVYERDGQVYVSSVNTGLIGRFFRIEASGPLARKRSDEGEIMQFLAKR